MDFAGSGPDTGLGDRGSGAALLSVPAGTAARRDRHGNHSRLPAWHGNGGKGGCRGFQGVFLFGGGLRRVVASVAGRLLLSPVCWRNSKWWCSATPPGGKPP